MRESDRAYDGILELMLTEKVKSGEMVNEKWLQEELSVGRTPLREALTRLVQDGYITSLARKGMVYTSLDFEELISLFNLRIALCPYLGKLLIQRVTDGQIAELEAYVEDMDKEEFHILSDLQIHKLLSSYTQDKYLQEILNRLEILAAVAAEPLTHSLHIEMKRMHQEYSQVIEALKERDEEKLVQALENHIPHYVVQCN